MKHVFSRLTTLALIVTLAIPAISHAQVTDVEVTEKKEKKEKKEQAERPERKEVDQIIITNKGDRSESLTIVVNGDKITVNGKAVDADGEVSVSRHKIRDINALSSNFRGLSGITISSPNKAMLGVGTNEADKGARIVTITDDSPAEKAGLKKDDIITMIEKTKISSPDDLSGALRENKPGDKVTVTYLRDDKEQKVTATLSKWDGLAGIGRTYNTNSNFDFKLDNIQTGPDDLKIFSQPYTSTWSIGGASTKLGLTVQDTDDGKGVKVLGVSDESNADKAGIEEEDVILEVDGKEVNGADEIAKVMRESKDKVSVKFRMLHEGKPKTVDVKIPRKLKTANL